jgi:hypothetical protein
LDDDDDDDNNNKACGSVGVYFLRWVFLASFVRCLSLPAGCWLGSATERAVVGKTAAAVAAAATMAMTMMMMMARSGGEDESW